MKRLSFLVALLLGMIVLVACPRGSVAGPLSAPSKLQATPGSSEIVLTWQDNSSAEEGFRIYRKLESDEEFPTDFIAETLADVETYPDTLVSAVETYVYQVRAFAGASEGELSQASNAAKPTLAENEATLQVEFDGDGAQGVVTSNPSGINCIQRPEVTSKCSFDFEIGETVTLTATPDPGSQFVSWGGACTGTSCTITMDSSKIVTATFQPIANQLIVTIRGDGTGKVESITPPDIDCPTACTATYPGTTNFRLKYTAAPDSIFKDWTNCGPLPPDVLPTDPRCFVTIGNGQGVEVIATFLARRDAPVINAFSASPAQVAPLGTPVVLSWDITFSGTEFDLELSDDKGNTYDTTGKGLTDTLEVGSFNSATTFTLAVTTDLFGSDTAQDSVTVGDGPRILTFEVGDTTITSADNTTLDWEVENADSVTLTIGGGTPETVPAVPANPRTVSPDDTTDYVLTATKAGFDAVSETRRITVGLAPVFTTDLSASDTDIIAGEETTLTWVVTGATTLTLEKDPETGATTTETVTGASETESPSVTTSYTIIATNNFGTTRSNPVEVTVTQGQPPTIGTFTATPSDLPSTGGDVTLTWSGVTGVDSPSATLVIQRTPGADIDVKGDADNTVVVPQTATTTYTLVADNEFSDPVSSPTRTVTVSELQPPTLADFAAAPNPSPAPGTPITFTWTPGGGAPNLLRLNPGAIDIPLTDSSFTLDPGPTVDTTYTLVARNSASGTTPTTAEVLVTVTPAPEPATIVNFSADPMTIDSGGESTLSWEAGGTAPVTVTISDGATDIFTGTGSSSSNPPVVVSPAITTTYTLTATNGVSPDPTPATVEVTVNPPPVDPPIIRSFVPTPNQIEAGDPSVLTWEVEGTEPIELRLTDEAAGFEQDVTDLDEHTVTPDTTTTYTLSATNVAGSDSEDRTVTVIIPDEPATIVDFTVDPTTVELGGSSTLSWEVTGTEPLTIDLLENGVLFVEDLESVGSLPVTPTPEGDYVYTLNAANEAGSDSEERTVTVEVPNDDDEG